ncbi:MAG: carboxypeptidase-like regulatory domain-containing protein [Burkholderiales bacterium]
MNPTRRCRVAVLVAVAVLSACGGGGGGYSLGGQGSASLSGTAAAGRPIAGATVTVKDVAGRHATQTTRSDGSYSFDDVSGWVWPVVARVEGGTLACGTQPNCAPTPNTQRYVGVSLGLRATQNTLNLTPMSHAIVSSAAHVDANGLFDLPLSQGAQRVSAALGLAGLAQFAGGIDAGRVFAGAWSSATEPGGTFTGQRGSTASACH